MSLITPRECGARKAREPSLRRGWWVADLENGLVCLLSHHVVRRPTKYLRCYGRHERPQMIRMRVV